MDNSLQVSNLSYDKNKITNIKMFEVRKKWRRYAFEIIMPSLYVCCFDLTNKKICFENLLWNFIAIQNMLKKIQYLQSCDHTNQGQKKKKNAHMGLKICIWNNYAFFVCCFDLTNKKICFENLLWNFIAIQNMLKKIQYPQSCDHKNQGQKKKKKMHIRDWWKAS